MRRSGGGSRNRSTPNSPPSSQRSPPPSNANTDRNAASGVPKYRQRGPPRGSVVCLGRAGWPVLFVQFTRIAELGGGLVGELIERALDDAHPLGPLGCVGLEALVDEVGESFRDE